MRRAQVPITQQLFREVFKIPASLELRGTHYDFDTDTFILYLRGEDLPEQCEVGEGETSIRLLPRYRGNDDDTVDFIGWGNETPTEVNHA